MLRIPSLLYFCLSYWPLGKGGKNRRRGKNENESDKRELIFKEDGQEYAQVIKMLGNGRLEAYCFDGIQRQCHIRGKLRKKVKLVVCTLCVYRWGTVEVLLCTGFDGIGT